MGRGCWNVFTSIGGHHEGCPCGAATLVGYRWMDRIGQNEIGLLICPYLMCFPWTAPPNVALEFQEQPPVFGLRHHFVMVPGAWWRKIRASAVVEPVCAIVSAYCRIRQEPSLPWGSQSRAGGSLRTAIDVSMFQELSRTHDSSGHPASRLSPPKTNVFELLLNNICQVMECTCTNICTCINSKIY